MKKIKKIKGILKRVLICFFVVFLIFALPSVALKKDENLERIYSRFLGEKTNFEGIIEIWNIDSFDGGSGSKTSFLTKVSKEFQKKNKGLYFMVRNLTEQEVLNLIACGNYPDLFSCSFGVAEKLQDSVKPFSNLDLSNIEQVAVNSGMVDKKQYAVPWCKSSYYLISTKDKLQKANIELDENFKLSNFAMKAGYTIHGKKSDKTIYSLSIGNSKYLLPQQSLKAYNKAGVELILENSYNKEIVGQSVYSSYCDFLADNSVMFIGTNRDIYRLDNRMKLGKITDVVFEELMAFTDLIQFMLVSRNIDETKQKYAFSFVEFLAGKAVQQKLAEHGLFSVLNDDNSSLSLSAMQNIIHQNFSDYATLNIFIKENEINKLQTF